MTEVARFTLVLYIEKDHGTTSRGATNIEGQELYRPSDGTATATAIMDDEPGHTNGECGADQPLGAVRLESGTRRGRGGRTKTKTKDTELGGGKPRRGRGGKNPDIFAKLRECYGAGDGGKKEEEFAIGTSSASGL